MIEELCCCTIIFVIAVIIFFRIFGRAIIVRQNRQPPPAYGTHDQPPQYREGPVVINMVKCSHCGRVYDETLPGCPGCGGF